MRFRPCIDIHNGKVKQIVGGSLKDKNNQAKENFISDKDAAWFAKLYQKDNLTGGHIILLNAVDSEYYNLSKEQGIKALETYPNGLQIGGGITAENAIEFIEKGASHIIVTSYIFKDGNFLEGNLKKLAKKVGKEKIVIDLSCRKKDNKYYVVTNRWQQFTNMELTIENMNKLAEYCDEFLIHGVDVEGLSGGMETKLVKFLTNYQQSSGKPITYAGGIGSLKDLEDFKQITQNNLDITIGSALDLFGGPIPYNNLVIPPI
jgi:phosphoribosylformimino-5-aminoimidazole carboxamide ribotide isomerase